jgi:hypothetical protein
MLAAALLPRPDRIGMSLTMRIFNPGVGVPHR